MDLSRFAFKREDRRDTVPEAAKRPRVEPPAKPVEPPAKPDCSTSAECSSANAECWLQELELIRHFRSGRRATVDDFHAFLLSLHGPAARFWALVACLLSVQCYVEDLCSRPAWTERLIIGQPEARSGAESSLRRASWPKATPACFRHRCSAAT